MSRGELEEALQIVADYFPESIIQVARVIRAGNRQHNGDAPVLFWDRSKSSQHFKKGLGHWAQRGEIDEDDTRHTAKAAWRVLADLQLEEEGHGAPVCPAAQRAPTTYGELIPHQLAAMMLRDGVIKPDDDTGTTPAEPPRAGEGGN